MKNNFIKIRVPINDRILLDLSEIAELPEFHGNKSAALRESVHEKRAREAKRIFCVQHADGIIEIDPSAK